MEHTYTAITVTREYCAVLLGIKTTKTTRAYSNLDFFFFLFLLLLSVHTERYYVCRRRRCQQLCYRYKKGNFSLFFSSILSVRLYRVPVCASLCVCVYTYVRVCAMMNWCTHAISSYIFSWTKINKVCPNKWSTVTLSFLVFRWRWGAQ